MHVSSGACLLAKTALLLRVQTELSYRPTDDSNQPPGRGVLSMHGLTYGVIRVDSEEKLSVLTVQDVGLVMPGGECGRRADSAGVWPGPQMWAVEGSVIKCCPENITGPLAGSSQ